MYTYNSLWIKGQPQNPHKCNFNVASPQKMYLVMEICEGGELADALKTRERMSEEECKIIMSRLASAISYLHKNGAYCCNSRVIRLFDKGISFTCEWRHCLLINVTLSNTEWIYMHYVLYLNMNHLISELSILGWIHDSMQSYCGISWIHGGQFLC